jgi:hypothetical protein
MDMDRWTGRPIDNLESVYQSVEILLSTPIGSRVMVRQYGGGVAELLGRALTPPLFLAWRQLIGTAIDLWEKRLKVRRVSVTGSAEALRRGHAGLVIEADYRPRAYQGDMRVDRSLRLVAGLQSGQFRITS